METFILNEIKISSFHKMEDVKKTLLKFLECKSSQQIVTFNLDFLRNSCIDKNFQKVCQNASLVLPDGFGITSLIKIKYGINIKRITGNDIVNLVFNSTEFQNFRVAVIGSTTEVQNKIILKLQSQNVDLSKYLFEAPPLHFEYNKKTNNDLVNKIKNFKPDIIFLALGSPRQEYWLNSTNNFLDSKINIGVGAALDYYSGHYKRAPIIFQRFGLEWFWRLINEPKRLYKRYIIYDIPFYIKYFFKILTRE